MPKNVKLPPTPIKKGTCGKRPELGQSVYNTMAPPCGFKKKHLGLHDWETARWRIGSSAGDLGFHTGSTGE
jgi:hypothetical protein